MNSLATRKLPPVVRNALSQLKFKCIFAGRALRGTPVRRQHIQLANTLIGEQCGTPLEHWIAKTGEISRASVTLKNSPYVRFLKAAEEDPKRLHDPAFLRAQDYFAMAQVAIRHTGNYFAAVDEEGIFQQMRDFFAMYQSLRHGRQRPATPTAPGRSLRHSLIWVSALRDSNCFELSDGHHRASALAASGHTTVEALVVDRKFSYAQQQIHIAQQSPQPFAEQPVPLPEVSSWQVPAHIEHWLQAMLAFAQANAPAPPTRQTQTPKHGRRTVASNDKPTFLHAPCGFGWFVEQWSARGYSACGIPDSPAHRTVGNIAYRLRDDQLATLPDAWQTVSPADVVFAELGKLHSPLPFRKPTTDFFRWLSDRQPRLCFLALHHNTATAEPSSTSDLVNKIEAHSRPFGWQKWHVLASDARPVVSPRPQSPATLLAAVREDA